MNSDIIQTVGSAILGCTMGLITLLGILFIQHPVSHPYHAFGLPLFGVAGFQLLGVLLMWYGQLKEVRRKQEEDSVVRAK